MSQQYVKNPYIAALAKELKLSIDIQKSVVMIEREFNKKKSDLVKTKKWRGDANKDMRLEITKRKNKSLKEVLGKDLFEKKREYDRINRTKKD